VQRVLCYEVPSETDFGLDPTKPAFAPNVFVDITPHLEHKLAIVRLFGGEIGLHPFPRSEEGVRALAVVRGAAAGYTAAEAFRLVRETMGERT
jgi:LmbE family N-acetylglucosaminyl deacetylase